MLVAMSMFTDWWRPPTPTPPISSPTRRRGPENPAPGIKFSDVVNFLNPAPSLTSAIAERRAPRPADVAMDAGLFAAGFIPFAGPGIRGAGQAARAARPALETADAINARRNAINKLLNTQGPDMLSAYLDYPMLGYRGEGRDILSRFFKETSERIPAGTQMFRAPSAGQVMPRRGSQSVPLPREIGANYVPGRVQSTGGAADLQKLGDVLTGKSPTGGSQQYAPAMAAIEAMEDLPGIVDLNAYFNAINARGLRTIPNESTFIRESVLGPQTRYVVRDFNTDGPGGFPVWYLQAYAR